MSEKKRILFVDDDRNVLDGLRRMLYKMRQHWKMEFVTSGNDALKVMKEAAYDVVITDYRMPDINGAELLENIRKRYPGTIRFMLTGYSEQSLRSKAAKCVHQFISKPCGADKLKDLISRSFSIHDRLKSKEATKVLAKLRSLPVLPDLYQNVIDELHDPRCSSRHIGKMISKDIGMSAKLLQMANSVFGGLQNRIHDPVHAVVYLGLKTVEALVLTQGVFSKLPVEYIERFSVDALQEHCVRVGAIAKAICHAEEMSEDDLNIAMMAGILHDAGKMILISEFPEQFSEAIKISRLNQKPLWQVERELIGVTHAELGGCLLDLWGLPNKLIATATFHHEPWQFICDEFSVITAIYIANAIDHQMCCSLAGGCSSDINKNYLNLLQISEKWQKWCSQYLPIEPQHYEHVG